MTQPVENGTATLYDSNGVTEAEAAWNHTIPAGTDVLLKVGVGMFKSGDTPTVDTITYGGVAMVATTTTADDADNAQSIVYTLAGTDLPGSEAGGEFEVAISYSVNSEGCHTSQSFSGVDITETTVATGVAAANSDVGTDATPSTSIASSSDDLIVGWTQYYDVDPNTITSPDIEIITVDNGASGESGTMWRNAGTGSTVVMNLPLAASTAWGCHAIAIRGISAAAAALTGTMTATVDEDDITTGGKTIIITLTGDTFKAAGTGPIGSTADTQALIDGFDAASSPTNGWNNEVRDKALTSEVVRTSSTVATWTVAAQAGYDISSQEIITGTIPTDVLVIGAGALTATPTFTVDQVVVAANDLYYKFLLAGGQL